MTATLLAFELPKERKARAALESLSPEQRRAALELRHDVLTVLFWAQGMPAEQGEHVQAVGTSLDLHISALLGFEGFLLSDVPPEDE